MSDLETMAATMFGGTTPKAPAPAAPAQTTQHDTFAERMFGNLGAAEVRMQPEAMSEEDRADTMFGDSPIHGDAERSISNSMKELELMTPMEADKIANEWSGIFSEYQLNATESVQLADLGASVYVNPPSETTMADWEGQAKAALAQEYGPDGAGQALADAKALIARNPTLHKYLHKTGLGSHPNVVRIAAAKASALRSQGKL